MKLQSFRLLSVIAIITSINMLNTSCQSKANDADIKTAVETKLKAEAMITNPMVEVKNGVVTITGECMNDSCKNSYTNLIQTVTGVKSVVNNCTISNEAMPMSNEPVAAKDEWLTKNLSDLMNEFSTVKIAADSGIVHIAGNLTKDQWAKLKSGIEKLNPKGYDTSMLRIGE